MSSPFTRSKPPLRQLEADDIVVTVDGEDYHPHVGESAWFKPGASSNAMRVLMRLQALSKSNLTPDEADELAQVLTDAGTYVASSVVKWDWTDINGDPMPPITPDIAMGLDLQELMWLLNASVTGLAESARKNADSASTATSADATAEASVTSG